MLRHLNRLATIACRQRGFDGITFEAVRALGTIHGTCHFRPRISSLSRLSASTPLKMPSLSPTMSEGTIVRWLKKEGALIDLPSFDER